MQERTSKGPCQKGLSRGLEILTNKENNKSTVTLTFLIEMMMSGKDFGIFSSLFIHYTVLLIV